MAPPYRWLLFDADDTLFDYRRAEASALREAFDLAGTPFRDEWAPVYQAVNARAWREFEAGLLTAARLRVRRFEELVAELALALDPIELAAGYLRRLAAQTHLIEGALELIPALRAHHRLAIVTNGLSDVQRPRFAASPLGAHFEHLVISEEVGAAKPDPAIFRVALERMGDPDPSAVLMIGDNLGSDIAGGAAAGLDTCWFDPDSRGIPADLSHPAPTYIIRRLAELPALLGA